MRLWNISVSELVRAHNLKRNFFSSHFRVSSKIASKGCDGCAGGMVRNYTSTMIQRC
ncbi:hypothetical protein BDU57DRAFT_510595 [Ampelomyces quisqualis]|uniref:Uncharacterized protein n=1 Tax=Ampelomyces quisqualis TaxID=50730 RepID=A0A6A5R0R7_AMPQU|nr:hypothetical protein BDU57DRAFT_510595 [Ampelomyces quisqualis]